MLRTAFFILVIAISGFWLGRLAGSDRPARSAWSDERRGSGNIEITHTVSTALALREKAETNAERYALTMELGAMPLAALGNQFEALAKPSADDAFATNKELIAALQLVTERDPREAIRLSEKLFSGTKLQRALRHIIGIWSSSDPVATLNYVHELEFLSDDVCSQLGFSLSNWAGRDPTLALDTWRNLPEPKLSDPAAIVWCNSQLARGLADKPEFRTSALDLQAASPDFEGHLDWRPSAITDIFLFWQHEFSLEEISQWLKKHVVSAQERNEITLAVAVAVASAGDGAVQAGSWCSENIAGDRDERLEILSEFASQCEWKNPKNFDQWLRTLAPSEEKDKAKRGFIFQLEGKDREAAFLRTRQISDREMRKQTAGELWSRWLENAPVSAEAFTNKLKVDEIIWFNRHVL